MAKIRASLLERGQEVLGLKPARPVPSPRLGRAPAAPPGASSRNASGAAVHRTLAAAGAQPASLDQRPGLRKLLDAESEAAVGEDTSLPPATASPSGPPPLPATEWIAPVSPVPASPVIGRPATGAPPAAAPGASAPSPRPISESGASRLPSEWPDQGGLGVSGPAGNVPLTPEQEASLLQRPEVQAKLAELNRLIQAQYERISQDRVNTNPQITDWCHARLAEARRIVLHQKAGELAKAEWCLEQVRARLERAERSDQQVVWPGLITMWGIIWFGWMIYLIFDPSWLLAQLGLGQLNDTFIIPGMFLRTLFFGGIGGVAGVFYHVFKHVRQRSFDTHYLLSYFGKPFMGMIVGSMVYLTVFVVMRVLGLALVGSRGNPSDTFTSLLFSGFLFFIAIVAGFKENLVFALLNQAIKVVFGDDDVREVPAPAGSTR